MGDSCEGCPAYGQDEFGVWQCKRNEDCRMLYTQQATPHKCPVCLGFGRVQDPVPEATAINSAQCPACGGTGVLWR
jgi:hypothetical protein